MILLILGIAFKLLMLICAVTNAIVAYRQVAGRLRSRQAFTLGHMGRLLKSLGAFLTVFLFTRYSWLGNLGALVLWAGLVLEYRSDPTYWHAYWTQPAFPARQAKNKIAR